MKRNKILWFLLWILSLIGISFYGGAVSYGAFVALTLLPVVSYLYLFLVYFHFKLYQETQSKDMTCMQPMPYYFVLKNENHFGFASIRVKMFSDFSSVEKMPENPEYQLLPGEEFRYETKIICKYRGEYHIGVQEIILTDFLRIFHLRYKVSEALTAIVHPRMITLSSVYGLSQVTTLSPQSITSQKQEPDVLVRDYVKGDSLNKIHWKLSAREQTLKVRPDIGEGRQNVSLFLDRKRYSADMTDYLPLESQLLEMLLGISLFLVKQNIPVNAYYTDAQSPSKTITGLSDFEAFYTEISNLSFDADTDSGIGLEECLHAGVFGNTKVLICLFHALNDTLLRITEQIASRECKVFIYVVGTKCPQAYQNQSTPRRQIIPLPLGTEWEVML